MTDKKKVALCTVRKHRVISAASPPEGLLFFGKLLKDAGYDVRVFDILIDHAEEIFLQVMDFDPFLICFNLSTGSAMRESIDLSGRFQRKNKIVVWRGAMPTLAPEYCLDNCPADYIMRGEGEKVIVQLANVLSKNQKVNIHGVVPMGSTDHGEILKLSTEEVAHLEPGWDFINVDDYVREYKRGMRFIRFSLSRGCDGGCAFCSVSRNKPGWRPYDEKNLLKQLEYIRSRCEFNGIFYIDDNLFGWKTDPTKLAILEKINVPWVGHVRVDKINSESAKWFKKVKCLVAKIGAESGSNSILKSVGKGFKAEDILEAAKVLREQDIMIYMSFIAGLPGEGEREFNETLELVERLAEIDEKVLIHLCHFAPYPGTRGWKMALKHGFTPPENLCDWDNVDLSMPNVDWVDKEKMVPLVDKLNQKYFVERFQKMNDLRLGPKR
ncbi:MAG: B12-binding domain-containing radical SAM protein [Bacteriovoracaceae bacterium]|nr:B12-binding domain-containing radical SAM protein [Bacteriovoracaceae bacterium]